jgi:uncharacterized protein
MPTVAALQTHLASLGRVLLGYSGGVDSSLLAVAGTRGLAAGHFLAVIGRSASYPAAQYETALSIARQFEVPLLEVETGEMADPRYTANPLNRCYYCKSELWDTLRTVARERGYDTVIDGTNRDDLGEHRPGLQAAAELRVRSPLAESGWTKTDIRQAAHELGIPIWDAPASPCLSSRIQYGLAVTPERLRQVEAGEAFLRTLGITGDLRVRHHGDRVRIEATPAGQEILHAKLAAVEAFFSRTGIHQVEIDQRGYRRGALLNVLTASR